MPDKAQCYACSRPLAGKEVHFHKGYDLCYEHWKDVQRTGKIPARGSMPPSTVADPGAARTGSSTTVLVIAGAAIGSWIGFLLRPSVLMLGKLPFSAIVTRGSQFTGLDQILVPAAQASFNYVVVGAVLGGVATWGFSVWGRTMRSQSLQTLSMRPAAQPSSERQERPCPWCAEPILIQARVCKHCGREV